ncbi:uncharacterized protein BXZ73DRAFT_104599 [Epithele typhae]|uniref:uncharacterized protein n=1 Tax=Epithele typhae TaxID=378194 RepID=UPI002007854D|nr:uncharacterized protein BXZ73DRAFT_104599 [Epithele typhae]KAH9920865.1 hypothetical protein BXZ73DRAFT_104599 [Epithele typhae]
MPSNLPPPGFKSRLQSSAQIEINAPVTEVYGKSSWISHPTLNGIPGCGALSVCLIVTLTLNPILSDSDARPSRSSVALLFRAEFAQSLLETSPGKTLYEARHLFAGMSAPVISLLILNGLDLCLNAMATALKERAESRQQ